MNTSADWPVPATTPAAMADEPTMEMLFGDVPAAEEASPVEISPTADPWPTAPISDAIPLETLFARPTESTTGTSPLVEYIDGCSGRPVLAEALGFATRLDWICSEPPQAVISMLSGYRVSCRVLLCPPPGVTRMLLEAEAGRIPEHIELRVGFGLPVGHSLYLLSDVSGQQIFSHRTPTSTQPQLLTSWLTPAEIAWRCERFELLWQNRLQPSVQVETLERFSE